MGLTDGGDRERDVDGCWLQQSAASSNPAVVGMWCPLNYRGGVCVQCVCVCVCAVECSRVQCVCGVVGARQRWSMCVVLCCVVCAVLVKVLLCVVLVCEEPLVQIFGNAVCISVCWHVIFELE